MKIRWKKYEDNEDSWEPLSTMMEDIPAFVISYFDGKNLSVKQIGSRYFIEDNEKSLNNLICAPNAFKVDANLLKGIPFVDLSGSTLTTTNSKGSMTKSD